MNPDAAGIDVGSSVHYVCVPEGRDEQRVQKLGCFTKDLHNLARWLKKCKVTTVAMESTGVYWIALFQILESYELEVKLVNASKKASELGYTFIKKHELIEGVC